MLCSESIRQVIGNLGVTTTFKMSALEARLDPRIPYNRTLYRRDLGDASVRFSPWRPPQCRFWLRPCTLYLASYSKDCQTVPYSVETRYNNTIQIIKLTTTSYNWGWGTNDDFKCIMYKQRLLLIPCPPNKLYNSPTSRSHWTFANLVPLIHKLF